MNWQQLKIRVLRLPKEFHDSYNMACFIMAALLKHYFSVYGLRQQHLLLWATKEIIKMPRANAFSFQSKMHFHKAINTNFVYFWIDCSWHFLRAPTGFMLIIQKLWWLWVTEILPPHRKYSYAWVWHQLFFLTPGKKLIKIQFLFISYKTAAVSLIFVGFTANS